jgi:hypothetical protein
VFGRDDCGGKDRYNGQQGGAIRLNHKKLSMPSKSTVYACVALTAASPLLLHGHPERVCIQLIELCPVSDAFNVPDEPAPELSPMLIIAPPTAASTTSAPTVTLFSPGGAV